SRSSIDTCSAAGLDDFGSSLAEDIEVALAQAVLARLLRAELDVELHRGRHPFALAERTAEDGRVHVHVFVFARRTGAAVGDLNGNGRVQIAHVLAVAGIA